MPTHRATPCKSGSPHKDDSHDIAEIDAPIVEHTHISFELVPPTVRGNGAPHVGRTRKPCRPVAEDAGRINGYAYAGKYRDKPAYQWSTETTIYVGDGSRGSGMGRSCIRRSCETLAAQNYRRAFAGIALPNQASIALHEAVGFKHIGTNPEAGFKFDRWHDLGWWSFPLNIAKADPHRPFR